MLTSLLLFVLKAATFLLVVWIAWRAFHPQRKADLERAARLPFDDEASP